MEEDNIIKFKNKNKITESEINGLFLGLVRLIKKLALEEASEKLSLGEKGLYDDKQELERLLSQKDYEIEKLKEENNALRHKIKVKNLKILQLSCSKAKSLNQYKS